MSHPCRIAVIFATAAIFALLLLLQANVRAGEGQGAEIDLFNPPPGQAVTWKGFHEDPNAKTEDVWLIRDGLVICKGNPKGYLRTEQDFTNFVLKLEWRRPKEKPPGPGGVLVRMTGKDKIWPKSLEAQLNAGAAGDFWGLGGYHLSGPADRMTSVENDQLGTLTNLKKTHDAEKPPGEWNQYEIIADGDVVVLKINGQEVNRATGCDVVPGKICLTSEGEEIHFRNVRLRPKD
jgi:hypothetical protein